MNHGHNENRSGRWRYPRANRGRGWQNGRRNRSCPTRRPASLEIHLYQVQEDLTMVHFDNRCHCASHSPIPKHCQPYHISHKDSSHVHNCRRALYHRRRSPSRHPCRDNLRACNQSFRPRDTCVLFSPGRPNSLLSPIRLRSAVARPPIRSRFLA